MKLKIGLGFLKAVLLFFLLMVVVSEVLRRCRNQEPAEPPCSAQGSGPWPLAGDHVLGQLYFQLTDSKQLHNGIDLVAPPVQSQVSTVRAVESGTVVRVHGSEVVVASQADPAVGFAYIHVASIQVVENDPVTVGKELGLVAAFKGNAPAGEYDHLHLERVALADGVPPLPSSWKDAAKYHAVGNPLAWLSAPGDDAAPQIPDLPEQARPGCGSGPVRIALAENQPDGYLSGGAFLCPDALVDGQAIDVIVGVGDLPAAGSPWVNVPYCTRLRIREVGGGAVEYSNDLRLDGEQPPSLAAGARLLYRQNDWDTYVPIVGPRAFNLIVTNEPEEDGYWTARVRDGVPTTYQITVDVHDAAGNLATVTTSATVLPP